MSRPKGLDTVVIRYSEIGLKSKRVRRRFEAKLIQNIKTAFEKEGVVYSRVLKAGARIIARTSDPSAQEVVGSIPGVRSLSPALEVGAEIEEIKKSAIDLLLGGSGPFAVRAQRITKGFPLTSLEINRVVGSAIQKRTGRPVDLNSPHQEIGIEVVGNRAYIFTERVTGPGGLPVSTQGRVVSLLSGGIDSAVATWLMLKRGADVTPLHFRLVEEDHKKFRKLLVLLRRFAYGSTFEPVVEEWQPVLSNISAKLAGSNRLPWTCVFCKRSFLRRAEEIAEDVGALGMVTGDSLGEVASQTLQNLEVVSYGRRRPVYRPLIGLDKEEIISIAKRIGTYPISVERAPTCPYRAPKVITAANWERFCQVAREAGLEWLLE